MISFSFSVDVLSFQKKVKILKLKKILYTISIHNINQLKQLHGINILNVHFFQNSSHPFFLSVVRFVPNCTCYEGCSCGGRYNM